MKNLNYYLKRKHYVPVGFVLVFAIIGVIILFVSHAATPYAAIEAETGATGGATSTSDSKASGGSYLQFGSESTNPGGGTNPGTGSSSSPCGSGTVACGCSSGSNAAPCTESSPTGTGASGWGAPAFDEEFNETNGLDTTVWDTENTDVKNGITVHTSNEAVSNGDLILTLANSSSGAEISTNSYALPVGGFAEASVNFPGSGSTIYNWPAWWISGPCWPAAGENDIAEGLGPLSVTYHYGPCGPTSDSNGSVAISGTWSNEFHTYGIYRGASSVQVYYDGKQVRSYSTSDNGQPESLILTNGCDGGCTNGAQVKVDYVRAWQ